jgi:aryl carrier-like protein
MASIKHIYPLTPLQEGMYFHYVDKQSTAYFEQVEYEIKGALEVSLLKASLEKLVERHDILRTNFIHKPDHPILQVVSEHKPVDFSFFDLAGEPDQEGKISLFKAEDVRRGFDLKKDVLFRVSLFRLGNAHHRVICSNHHILLDGWSRGFVLNDLFDIYQASKNNDDSKLRPPRSFRDYVMQTKEKNTGASEQYWKTYLEGLAAANRLIDVLGTTGGNDYVIGKKAVRLSSGETIKKFCARQKYTVNAFVNAAWAITLSMITTSQDLVFGVVMSGRSGDMQHADEYVGLLINTVALRVRVTPQHTFRSVLSAVQADFVAHEKHQHYPLKSILTHSKLRHSLIDHILVFENYPKFASVQSEENGLDISAVKSHERSSYDLTLVFTEMDALEVLCSFNQNVFPENTIAGLLGSFEFVIGELLQDTDRSVGEMNLDLWRQFFPVLQRDNASQHSGKHASPAVLPQPVENYHLSEVERLLHDAWSQELKLQEISIFDNLFELGADSIMAIQVATKIKRKGYNYTPSNIYENPTIFDLAKIVSRLPLPGEAQA